MTGLAATVQPYIDGHALAGAVMLVAGKDRVLELTAVGYSDVAAKEPMRSNNIFWIASESKPITATALMMLVDEGKVRLDDPVAKYLPEFGDPWVKVNPTDDHVELRRPRHAITVREILSHTSGLPFASAMEQPTLDLLPLRVAVRSYGMTPLNCEPGTKYDYSNAGINAAGRIIEVVSGRPYEQFLSERLFRSLGMKDTTFRPNKRQLARLVKTYKPDAANTGLQETQITQLKYPLDDPSRYPFPAGGFFSTATDMCHFGQMILNGGNFAGKRLVSEESVQEMTQKQTGKDVPDTYGLGWGVGEDTFGHGGANSTNLSIHPKPGLVLIWMVAHAGFPNNGGESGGAFQRAAVARYGQ